MATGLKKEGCAGGRAGLGAPGEVSACVRLSAFLHCLTLFPLYGDRLEALSYGFAGAIIDLMRFEGSSYLPSRRSALRGKCQEAHLHSGWDILRLTDMAKAG